MTLLDAEFNPRTEGSLYLDESDQSRTLRDLAALSQRSLIVIIQPRDKYEDEFPGIPCLHLHGTAFIGLETISAVLQLSPSERPKRPRVFEEHNYLK